MTLTDEKLKKKTLIKQKNISEVIRQPWAKKMLSPYIITGEKEKVLRFKDFKKILKTNQKVVRDHLNSLCDVGFLRRVEKGKGYVYSKQYPLYYIFKYDDLKLIHDCPIESIYSIVTPYRKIEGVKSNVRCLSIYGLKNSNAGLENIIKPLLRKLPQYIDSMHNEELQIIINDECKKIKDKDMIKLIKKWHTKLGKNKLLHPLRIRGEIEPVKIQFDTPEKYREEFKVITERIWKKFYLECPPIGIMLRF